MAHLLASKCHIGTENPKFNFDPVETNRAPSNSSTCRGKKAGRQSTAGDMAASCVVKIPSIGSEYSQHDLAWSLQPVLFSLRVFGIDLDGNRPRSLPRRCAFMALAASVSLFFGFSGTDVIIRSMLLFRHQAAIETVYMMLYIGAGTICAISLLAALTVASQSKWEALWMKLQEVEQCNGPTGRLYGRMRRVSGVSIAFSVLMVRLRLPRVLLINPSASFFLFFLSKIFCEGAAMLYMTSPLEEIKQSLSREQLLLQIIGKTASDVFHDTTLVLFITLMWFSSASIQAITADSETHRSTAGGVPADQLIKWQKNYLAILELIEGINRLFGPVLLAVFSTMFFSNSILFFRVVSGIFGGSGENGSVSILRIVRSITVMTALVSATEMMKGKVTSALHTQRRY